jgi:hypothetical protein
MFTGGFLKYREYCTAATQDGYRDFAFGRAREVVEA